jgi:hypothetical protein
VTQQGFSGRLFRSIGAIALIVVGSILVPEMGITSASATTTTSAAYFDSEAGDYIGGGQQIAFSTVTYNGLRGGYPTFTVSSPGHSFQVWFAAAAGSPLTPGTYEGAQRFDFRAAGQPGLDVFGDGRGCNTVEGRFVVDDATYDGNGDVLTFSARFEDHCEGGAAALFGVLSYNSTAPYRTRSLSSTALNMQSTNGAGAPATMTVTNNGPAALSPSVGLITGASSADFAVTGNTCPASLPSGSNCTVTVTFTPSTANPESAQLTYSDELAPLGSAGEPAGAGSGRTIALSGTLAGVLPLPYHPLPPTRICDTRAVQPGVAPNPCNFDGTGAGSLGPGDVGDLGVAGFGGVPSSATAVMLNVTVTNTTTPGYLTVYPTGVALPNASNLNWVAGKAVPNLVEVPVGASGQVSFYNPFGQTDIVVDVEGYVAPSLAPGSGLYNPLTPSRICDSRPIGVGIPSNQCDSGGPSTLGPQGTKAIQVTGRGGVPSSGVAAVALNVTVTNTTVQGFLTVFPDGGSVPNASNLNWDPGVTIANRVVVPVGANGKIDLYNDGGSADVIVDVTGWFTDTSNASATGSRYVPLTPTRICDSRTAQPGVPANQCNHNGASAGTLGQQATIPVGVTGSFSGVPANATAAVLNVTVTDTSASSFLTVFPHGVARPNSSDLNWAPGLDVPNLVIATLPANGSVDVFNAWGSTDVVVDVEGYYMP